MNAIELKGVTRGFGGKEVLRGVTATAEAGKVVGVLGRNGEGKTTLFRILTDLLAADSGEVTVLGQKPDGSGELRQSIGWVPERPSFHDFMTVGEVLELRSRFFRNWDKARAAELGGRLELDPATKIAGASKGTLGKLAWVCAASHDPELFILDEPTSGLDALVREDVLAHLIDELQSHGKTILVSNHRMEEMAGILDEIWVLAGGRVAAVHQAETLRREACLLTGRLKAGAKIPAGLVFLDQGAPAPLVEWVVFDAATADLIAGSGLLEALERRPLDADAAMKLLLKKGVRE